MALSITTALASSPLYATNSAEDGDPAKPNTRSAVKKQDRAQKRQALKNEVDQVELTFVLQPVRQIEKNSPTVFLQLKSDLRETKTKVGEFKESEVDAVAKQLIFDRQEDLTKAVDHLERLKSVKGVTPADCENLERLQQACNGLHKKGDIDVFNDLDEQFYGIADDLEELLAGNPTRKNLLSRVDDFKELLNIHSQVIEKFGEHQSSIIQKDVKDMTVVFNELKPAFDQVM